MELSADEIKDQLIDDLQQEAAQLRLERAQLRAAVRKLTETNKEADENASQESQD